MLLLFATVGYILESVVCFFLGQLIYSWLFAPPMKYIYYDPPWRA